MNRLFALAPAVAAAAVVAALPARATDSFDGSWQVTIVTEKGTCDKAYSYPLAVKGGSVTYAGDTSAKIDGRVEDGGSVQVRISLGDKSARGTGRLSASSGTGTWSGGECSGRWTASRKA